MRLTRLILILALNITLSRAATWYVETTGNDSNGCTSTSIPCLTIAHAISLAAAGDTIAVQTGTYVQTTVILPGKSLLFQGYSVTAGDCTSGNWQTVAPLITTVTNSTNLFSLGANYAFQCVSLSNTASIRAEGLYSLAGSSGLSFRDGKISGFTTCIDGSNGAGFAIPVLEILDAEITGCTSFGIFNQGSTRVKNSWVHDNAVALRAFGNNTSYLISEIENSAITANTTGIYSVNTINFITISNSVISENTGDAIYLATSPFQVSITNSVLAYNGGWDINVAATPSGLSPIYLSTNATGNNTSGNYLATHGSGIISLTAVPWTNYATGNFTLNATTGGGVLLKGTGIPGLFPGGTTTGFPDINVVQSQASSSGSGSYAQ